MPLPARVLIKQPAVRLCAGKTEGIDAGNHLHTLFFGHFQHRAQVVVTLRNDLFSPAFETRQNFALPQSMTGGRLDFEPDFIEPVLPGLAQLGLNQLPGIEPVYVNHRKGPGGLDIVGTVHRHLGYFNRDVGDNYRNLRRLLRCAGAQKHGRQNKCSRVSTHSR